MSGTTLDVERIIAEVAGRHGVLLRPDDPAFALVTINRLVLESHLAHLEARLDQRIKSMEHAIAATERRAGMEIAKRAKAFTAHPRINHLQTVAAAALLFGFVMGWLLASANH